MARKGFNAWQEFETWLNHKGMFHMELGLGRIARALKNCGLAKQPFSTAQVLGTNGKGSTSTFLAILAQAHGLKTGLYISPHFLSPRERILINGKQLSEQDWLAAINQLSDLTEIEELTYFELLTLLAVHIFANCGVDFAVFEAGLGGRNDATTAIHAGCQCFTPIALDHVNIIGPDIAAIAADKAAAIKPGSCVFSAPQYPESAAALGSAARAMHASLRFVGPHSCCPGLAGDHQYINAGLALAAWHHTAQALHVVPRPQAESSGLKNIFLPGRFQKIPATQDHPDLILDGAHNPHAISQLCRSCASRPAAVIYSALADKDWQTCLPMLLRLSDHLIVPQLENSRAAQACEIADYGNKIKPQSCMAARDLASSLSQPNQGPILICGSLYLLADFYKLYPRYLERKDNDRLSGIQAGKRLEML